jgi:hypothetical protein
VHFLYHPVSKESVEISYELMQGYDSRMSSDLIRLSAARSRRLNACLRKARTHYDTVGPFTNFDHHDGWLAYMAARS